MRSWAGIAVLFYVVGPAQAVADAPQKSPLKPAPQPQERLTLERFGTAEKTCAEWSDGCAVCKRLTDGSFGCSLTGIACQPAQIECRQPADKPTDPK